MFQNRLFFALASRSGFGAAIPVVVMYKKASLYNCFFCQSLLCAKDFVRKSLLCVKASLYVKASLCKSFCVCV